MGLSVFVVLSISIALCSGGSLFLAGGNVDDNNTEIYGGMVTAAGGHNAVVAVITAASADGCCGPDSSWALYEPIFLSYGPRNVIWIPIDVNHTENNHNPAVVKNLTESTLFFFSGGDQARIITSFVDQGPVDSPALAAIRSKFTASDSIVVAGSSAGLACQSAGVMIENGVSYSALVNGSFAGSSTGEDNLEYDPNGGLAFFPTIVDSHFSQRARQGRLIRLLSDTRNGPRGVTTALGVDENTAIQSTARPGVVAIVGASGVWWFDVSGATTSDVGGWAIDGVRASYATRGDELDQSSGKVFPASWKTPLEGRERRRRPISSPDIFNSPYNPSKSPLNQFVLVAQSLFDSREDETTSGSTYENSPIYCVEMSRAERDARAWDGTQGDRFISFQYLRIAIKPCPNRSRGAASARHGASRTYRLRA